MADEERVVVVGGGMAGARLAQQLGAADADAAVELIGEEPHAPYNRVLLAEVLAGRYGPETVALPAGRARRLSGVRAVRIDRAERRVVCDDGGVRPYDRLVLATGAAPVLPPLRGLLPPGETEPPGGVRAFRTLDDCLALRGEVRPGVPAVVAGGGLLGVSAAGALARCGARVVLAHQGEHLMNRQLDAGSAELVKRHLEGLGVEVHTECRVRGVRTRRTGRTEPGTRRPSRVLRAVELADGHVLDAGVAVLACGVRPRVRLAEAAGLEVSRGVVVDGRLRTSDPDVYAIGDCAEHPGSLRGRARPALEQADLLARVLAGQAPPPYRGSRALTRLTLAGHARSTGHARYPGAGGEFLDLAAFGDPLHREDDDVVHLADATRGVYRKVVVRGDRLAGGVLLGDLTSLGPLARAWEDGGPLPPEPPAHLLTHDGEAPR